MTEPEINEQIAKFDGLEPATPFKSSRLWKESHERGYHIIQCPNYSQDETALRQVLGKLSDGQRRRYIHFLWKAFQREDARPAHEFPLWLLFEVSTATKARVLAEMVKEVNDKPYDLNRAVL